MRKVQLVIENTFSNSSLNTKEIGINVFDRVYDKLVRTGGPLGKVHPLYINLGDTYKVLGVLTMNESGSYSLFLELPGYPDIDHVTFNKDLKKDTHHYTRVTESGREKVLPITAQHLTNQMYHGVTVSISSLALLKDVPKEIIFQEIYEIHLSKIQKAFITDSESELSTSLVLPEDLISVCFQFFLVPNEIDYRNIALFDSPLKSIDPEFELEPGSQLFCALIPHHYQKEYSIGILAFGCKKKIGGDYNILSMAKQAGFYSKVEIKNRHSH